MNKLVDWKNRLKDRHMLSVVVALFAIIIAMGIWIYKKQVDYRQASENQYNMAFYELVNYVQDVETYLAKSLISSTSEHGAETLTNVWKEANLAQVYLSRLPIESVELEKTAKFLNQVSDYSYSLSRKNIEGVNLTDDEIKNLEELHQYSLELYGTLNQLSTDLNNGNISWNDLNKSETKELSQQVSSNVDLFNTLEENFHEYEGLIYDGAFSEHLTSSEIKALTGEEIDENKAMEVCKDFIGKDRIKDIQSLGESENANINGFNFFVKLENDKDINISISKKGGHIVSFNCNRKVEDENISFEEANKIGIDFLNQKGFYNMKETYYLKDQGVLTINYAYKQDDVVMYPDLIKIKVALDNGEILGMETTGFLNNHIEKRDLSKVKIDINKAKKELNKNLNILSEGMAVIPTKYKTEILCYEFKGKVNDTDFLVYVNVENGKQEDVLIITDTPNGILTI